MREKVKEQIFETGKMLAIGIWNSPPIELLTAAVVAPLTISASLWMLQWLAPLMTIVGCEGGLDVAVQIAIERLAPKLFPPRINAK